MSVEVLEGAPGTFSHCGNRTSHHPHTHSFAMNEGRYDNVQCLGTPQCQWFLNCTRPAAGMVPHPILVGVPTCSMCAARFGLTLELFWPEALTPAGEDAVPTKPPTLPAKPRLRRRVWSPWVGWTWGGGKIADCQCPAGPCKCGKRAAELARLQEER